MNAPKSTNEPTAVNGHHKVADTELDAIRKGVRDALRVHKALGQDVVAMKDGKIVWVSASEIVIEEEADHPDPKVS